MKRRGEEDQEDQEGREMDEKSGRSESLLTSRQALVLKMRRQGLSQQEVAEVLGTTRSNVSILEKRALVNVGRARATLKEWTMIQAPVSITVPAGTDLFEVPALVFAEADRSGIKLDVGSVDIVVQIRSKAPKALKKRVVIRGLQVAVTEEGTVLVLEADPE